MRINDIEKRTGISKRTIDFYVKEGLLNPKVEKANGYRNFSAQDVEQLEIISKLRKLEFSIADIRTMLSFPSTISYYI